MINKVVSFKNEHILLLLSKGSGLIAKDKFLFLGHLRFNAKEKETWKIRRVI